MPTDYAQMLLSPEASQQAPTAPIPGAVATPVNYAQQLLNPEQPAVDKPVDNESEPGFIESMVESFTGDKRRLHDDWEEVPVNVQTQQGTVPIQDHMSMARDNNLARAEIFQSKLPDAEVYWDENMIPYTDYFGKPRYLNTPGASMGDVSEAINTVPMELAGAMGGAKVGQMIGKKILIPGIAQMVGAGTGLAGASVGQDEIAGILGSEQGIDKKRAMLMGAFGVGGEGASLLLGRFFSRFAASRKMISPDGQITKRGRKVLKQYNVDPDGVTPQFVDAWSKLADDAVDPAHAIAIAEANTLPKSVRLSKGDVTRDVDQQAFEIAAVKGSRGEAAKNEMTAFREGQQDDLMANEQAIQAAMGAGDAPRVAAGGEGMERVQSALADQYKTARGAVKAAYDKAGAMGAGVKAVDVADMGRYMEKQLSDFAPEFAGGTFSIIKKLMPQVGTSARPISVNIKYLEKIRRQLSTVTRGNDRTEAAAASKAISVYDKYMNALQERALLLGDQATLSAYRGAGRLRAKQSEMFESDKVMSMIMDKQRGILQVTPEQAMNAIFTKSGLGYKGPAANTLKKIKKVLGKDSAEWGDLREEAIRRLFQSTRSRELRDNLERAFSPAKFVSAMDDAFMQNRSTMNVLFNAKEQGLLRQLRNVTARLIPKRGADNFSNTSAEIMRMMQGVFGGGAAITRDFLSTVTKKIRETRQGRLAGEAVDPMMTKRVPEVRTLPPGSLGGFSGLGAAQVQQQQRNTRPPR